MEEDVPYDVWELLVQHVGLDELRTVAATCRTSRAAVAWHISRRTHLDLRKEFDASGLIPVEKQSARIIRLYPNLSSLGVRCEHGMLLACSILKLGTLHIERLNVGNGVTLCKELLIHLARCSGSVSHITLPVSHDDLKTFLSERGTGTSTKPLLSLTAVVNTSYVFPRDVLVRMIKPHMATLKRLCLPRENMSSRQLNSVLVTPLENLTLVIILDEDEELEAAAKVLEACSVALQELTVRIHIQCNILYDDICMNKNRFMKMCHALSKCVKLQRLSVEATEKTNLLDLHVTYILEHCPHTVHALSISGFSYAEVPREVLKHVREIKCKDLDVLDLSQGSAPELDALFACASRVLKPTEAPQLRHLGFCRDLHGEQRDIFEFLSQCGHNIHTMNIMKKMRAANAEDAASLIFDIAHECCNLRNFTASNFVKNGNGKYFAEAIGELLCCCSKLESLDISRNAISVACMQPIMSGLDGRDNPLSVLRLNGLWKEFFASNKVSKFAKILVENLPRRVLAVDLRVMKMWANALSTLLSDMSPYILPRFEGIYTGCTGAPTEDDISVMMSSIYTSLPLVRTLPVYTNFDADDAFHN